MSYGKQNLTYMREIVAFLNNNAVAASATWYVSDPPLFKCVITIGGSGQQDEALKAELEDVLAVYALRIERLDWLLSLWGDSWTPGDDIEPSSHNMAYFRIVVEFFNSDRDITTKWYVTPKNTFDRVVAAGEYSIHEPCVKDKMEELAAKYIASVEKINWLLSLWQPVEES